MVQKGLEKWNRSGTEEENDGKLVKIGGKIGQNWWKKWSKKGLKSGTEVEQKWNRRGK